MNGASSASEASPSSSSQLVPHIEYGAIPCLHSEFALSSGLPIPLLVYRRSVSATIFEVWATTRCQSSSARDAPKRRQDPRGRSAGAVHTLNPRIYISTRDSVLSYSNVRLFLQLFVTPQPQPIRTMSEELKTGSALSTPPQEDSISFGDVKKRRIWRTLDIHLLPFVSLLYLMSFL